jgi:hypothetical protein
LLRIDLADLADNGAPTAKAADDPPPS